jgi:hypothetical protein
MQDFIKLNYLIRSFYDKKNISIDSHSFYCNILNNGVVIKDDKLFKSSTFDDEMVVVDIFQQDDIIEVDEYINRIYTENDKLKIILIEEL